MQLSHDIEMQIARAGLVADSGLTQDVISRLAEDAAGAKAGTMVIGGTDPTAQAIVPVAAFTNAAALGVVQYDSSKEPAATAAAKAAGNEFDTEQMLPVLRSGRIWVLCDAAATILANGACFVRYAAGAGGSVLGTFREDDPGSEAQALTSAKFVTTHKDVVFGGATTRIALIELNPSAV